MHELSITRNIVAIAAEAAAGRPVRRVSVAIGALSGVMVEAVRFCFDLAAEGTEIAGADLVIEEIEGWGLCRDCGSGFAMPTLFTPCPCGSRHTDRIAGEELSVRSIEMEEAA